MKNLLFRRSLYAHGSSSALINLIHVLQLLETVDTATRNRSAKSFSNSPSLEVVYQHC